MEIYLFFYNNEKLQEYYKKSVGSYFKLDPKTIIAVNGRNNEYDNYKIIKPISENICSSVFKAKNNAGLEVAIKKIFKEKTKYQMKLNKISDEISEEDFTVEID